MTTTGHDVRPSASLDPDAVLRGQLPVQISMEPILEGAPFAYETVVHDGPDGFFAVWACDAGVYPRVKDRRGSFMYILEGDATITDQDGTSHHLTPDTVIVLPYGWVGQWDIRETIRKVYLHSTPAAPLRDGVQPSAFLDAARVLGPVDDAGTVAFGGPDGTCVVRERPPGQQPLPTDGHGRFTYVMAGSATVTVADGSTHELLPGSVLALPSGTAGTCTVTTTLRTLDVVTTPAAPTSTGQETA